MSARDPGLAFTDGALQFESWADKLWDPMGRDVAEAAVLQPGEKVLDACCGTGAATLPAALAVGPGGTVDGVDLSTGLLRIAAANLAERGILNTTLTEADVTQWRGHRTFDAVLCSYSMFFFSDMEAGIEHLASMLRPGGRLVSSTWVEGALEPFAGLILDAAVKERPRLAGVVPLPNQNMARVASVAKLSAWLEERGLEDVSVSTHPLTLTVDDEMAWSLVMGSGWRTLLPRDPEAIARVRRDFMASVGPISEMNSDAMIATASVPRRDS
ncbi:ubiquinone/menaquinone biosynthesis C-methylase UbiE [Arthrobacter stackebrandtii]|uniref:Ubiquinone/menaquinone biosynthesis C-methylase UbiE n=1 Tax=Arthrobacter stackebrandtii TaxID=272161 RepID=A0ABS4YY02_9MICC|nr:class I SAM-dependent methyltransferase [Arthrobacter stackebrandtii]MBP2413681.1 ubiquinone/menaquinone biosynthesis C-methylase UbiE [Arthrobacter stackebrandtii]PYG99980.1 class I SAM-dependent methyltransferase [Arthrobacter stackebrandtii]